MLAEILEPFLLIAVLGLFCHKNCYTVLFFKALFLKMSEKSSCPKSIQSMFIKGTNSSDGLGDAKADPRSGLSSLFYVPPLHTYIVCMYVYKTLSSLFHPSYEEKTHTHFHIVWVLKRMSVSQLGRSHKNKTNKTWIWFEWSEWRVIKLLSTSF